MLKKTFFYQNSEFLALPHFFTSHKPPTMATIGLMEMVRIGVRRRERKRMRGRGRFRQLPDEGAVAFAEGLRTS